MATVKLSTKDTRQWEALGAHMSKANLCSQDVSLTDEIAKRDGEIC